MITGPPPKFHGLRDILCVSLGCYVEAYRTWVAVVMGYLGHFRALLTHLWAP